MIKIINYFTINYNLLYFIIIDLINNYKFIIYNFSHEICY